MPFPGLYLGEFAPNGVRIWTTGRNLWELSDQSSTPSKVDASEGQKPRHQKRLGETTVWQRFGSSFSYETAGDTGRFALVTKYVEAHKSKSRGDQG